MNRYGFNDYDCRHVAVSQKSGDTLDGFEEQEEMELVGGYGHGGSYQYEYECENMQNGVVSYLNDFQSEIEVGNKCDVNVSGNEYESDLETDSETLCSQPEDVLESELDDTGGNDNFDYKTALALPSRFAQSKNYIVPFTNHEAETSVDDESLSCDESEIMYPVEDLCAEAKEYVNQIKLKDLAEGPIGSMFGKKAAKPKQSLSVYTECKSKKGSGDLKSKGVVIELACIEIRNALYANYSLQAAVDFSDPVYQEAYVGQSMGSHLTAIVTKLNDFWIESADFRRWLHDYPALNVCSIGGGPGTDILGLGLFFEKYNMANTCEGVIFDLYDWEDTFRHLLELTKIQLISCSYCYVPFDFFSPMPSSVRHILGNADMVMMVKFITAVAQEWETCVKNLRELFSLLKPGALLLFIDNAGASSFDILWEAADGHAMRPLVLSKHDHIRTSRKIVERLHLSRNCCTNCNPQPYTKISSALYEKVSS